MSLQDLGLNCGTDKADVHSYLPIYERELADFIYRQFNLLEIGIHENASVKMWLEWFPRVHVHGIDECQKRLDNNRATFYHFTQQDSRIRRLFKPESLEVIIDDGSHVPDHQHITAWLLWPCLARGGYYFVEDIVNSGQFDSWKMFPGFKVWENYKNGRSDDILIMLRKP